MTREEAIAAKTWLASAAWDARARGEFEIAEQLARESDAIIVPTETIE